MTNKIYQFCLHLFKFIEKVKLGKKSMCIISMSASLRVNFL